jgi:hypothetical protein
MGVACVLVGSQKPVWLHAGLGWIVAGNVADLLLTLWGLRLEVIYEANPVFASLLEWEPVLAGGIKLAVALWGSAVLYWAFERNPRLVAAGVLVVGAGMLVVLKLHLDWIWWHMAR